MSNWFRVQPVLGRDGFLDGELEWKVPQKTPKGLCLTTSSP